MIAIDDAFYTKEKRIQQFVAKYVTIELSTDNKFINKYLNKYELLAQLRIFCNEP